MPFPVNIVAYEKSGVTTQLVTVLTSAFIALLCPLAALGNALVFVAVLRRTDLRTVYNTSILFLAASDLAVSVVSCPAFVVYQVSKLTTNQFSCAALVIYTSAVFLCTGASLLTLILITLERYLAIFHPYKYQEHVTKRKIISLMLATWVLYSTLILLARFYFSASTVVYSVIATVLILSCVFTTLYVYCKVYALARRVRTSVGQQGSFSHTTNNNNNNCSGSSVNNTETKASVTVCCITGAVVVCFLPTVCASAVYQAKLLSPELIYHAVYPLTDSAVMLSALLDPLIYVFRTGRVRESLKQAVRGRGATPKESSRSRRTAPSSRGRELRVVHSNASSGDR